MLIIYDTRLKGFGLRVSGSAKAYFAEGKVNGKTRRVKIGTHEKGLSTEEARRMAQALLTEMQGGIDPNAKKREAREHEAITLRRSFASIAEAEVSAYQLKRMLNHSMGGDVTAGYIVSDAESLRDGMERVARKIMHFGEGKTGKLIELAKR